jgi:hypothetical protein
VAGDRSDTNASILPFKAPLKFVDGRGAAYYIDVCVCVFACIRHWRKRGRRGGMCSLAPCALKSVCRKDQAFYYIHTYIHTHLHTQDLPRVLISEDPRKAFAIALQMEGFSATITTSLPDMVLCVCLCVGG